MLHRHGLPPHLHGRGGILRHADGKGADGGIARRGALCLFIRQLPSLQGLQVDAALRRHHAADDLRRVHLQRYQQHGSRVPRRVHGHLQRQRRLANAGPRTEHHHFAAPQPARQAVKGRKARVDPTGFGVVDGVDKLHQRTRHIDGPAIRSALRKLRRGMLRQGVRVGGRIRAQRRDLLGHRRQIPPPLAPLQDGFILRKHDRGYAPA